MIDPKTIRPGNWLLYIPEHQYCTVLSIGAYIVVDDYKSPRNCHPADLTPVKINFGHPTTYGFGLGWIKKSTTGMLVSLIFEGEIGFLANSEGDKLRVDFVHQLQNAYYKLTGEELNTSLYGSPI